MKSKIFGWLVCLAIIALCSGCGTEDSRQSESPLDVPAFESPVESPVVPTATPWPSCLTLIEPVGNTVCGYIVGQSGNKPVVGRPVFLAKALFSADNSMVLAALNQEVAPKGISDGNGMFYIVDVPSNLYFLMIDDYPQPVMLHEPDKPTNDLMVDWRETEGAVDVGIIPTHLIIP